MILLYGLPSLVAQGLIFVGFMYVMAYLIQGLEFLFNKKKTAQHSNNLHKKSTNACPATLNKEIKQMKVQYKVILYIKSDLIKLNSDLGYMFLSIQSIQVNDKKIPFQEIFDFSNQIGNDAYEIEECVDTYWLLHVEDSDFDENKLKFICLSKNSSCSNISVYSASEIFYGKKKYRLHRIEELSRLDIIKSNIAFDNFVATLSPRVNSIMNRNNKPVFFR